MPVVSQSIIKPIVPVGARTVAWRVADAVFLAVGDGGLPGLLAGVEQLGRDGSCFDRG